jgi:hypothetical protein
LGQKNVFFDKWNLDEGLLPSGIAKGVTDSNWFILIASKNSMESRWVKYEINLALIRWIKDRNYHIVVARIDDCEIIPELSPFLYVNYPNNSKKVIDEITKLILSKGKDIIPKEEWRKSIIDRNHELDIIETVSYEEKSLIFLTGTYGIGKTTLAEHAANKFFEKTSSRFPLTPGHDILLISLEMASRAGLPLPAPNASEIQLLDTARNAANELIRQGNIIFFDNVESVTDDDRRFKDFFLVLLSAIISKGNPPIFIACSHFPRLDEELTKKSHILRVGPLEDNYILALLQNWIKMSDPRIDLSNKGILINVTKELHGYPLAARLASNVIVKYSIEQALNDL